MKQRQLNRRKRARQERKQRKHNSETTNRTITPCVEDESMNTNQEQPHQKSPLLTGLVKAAGFIPMLALVAILGTNQFYINLIPWFQPVIDDQVAILTLTAGNAAIIGIFMDKNLSGLNKVALLTAAIATYLAGHQAIGDNIAGKFITIVLSLSAIVVILAEFIVAGFEKARRFIRSWTGLLFILFVVVGIPIAAYNQLQNENYIRDWILIPIAAIIGFAILVAILWLLVKLSLKCSRVAYSRLKWLLQYIRNWLGRHRPGQRGRAGRRR